LLPATLAATPVEGPGTTGRALRDGAPTVRVGPAVVKGPAAQIEGRGRPWGGGPAIGIAVAAALATVATARGEVLHFQGGGRVQLRAEVEGSSVRVFAPDGVHVFDRDDFARIVPGHSPEADWQARRKAESAEGDSRSRFAAAWWALEHGLTAEAVAALRRLHDSDPDHQPTARLVARLDRLARPLPDPDLVGLRKILPAGLAEARGPHVLLLYQGDPAEAAERIALIEDVITTYYMTFVAQGLDLELPDRRLATAFLARQADYLAYIRSEAGPAFATTRGYFDPVGRWVVAYDGRGRPDHDDRARALTEKRSAIAATRAGLPSRGRFRIALPGERPRTVDAAGARALLDRLDREADRDLLLLDLRRRTIDVGTAAHETVHQLASISGLAPRDRPLPTWLHEGLAMQFEAVRGGRWAGPGPVNELRLVDWRGLSGRPTLASLVTGQGFGLGYDQDRYAQAWAFVYFLRNDRPDAFLAYLDLLRAPCSPEIRSPDRHQSSFVSALGDPARLEPEWTGFLDRLRSPLESEASLEEPRSRPTPPTLCN